MEKRAKAALPRETFERLVREHHSAVYASSMRIVRDAEAALDVTQDVYVALLEGRIVLEGSSDERVLRWFAVRKSLQVLRERSNRARREEEFAVQEQGDPFDSLAVDADTASALERFVARLPADLRAALHLRFHEGLTFARVGEALEISEPAAHDRVKRALAKLKDNLSRAGLAALALDVERALNTAPPAQPVPQFLAKKLIALHSATATTSITAALVASLLVVVGLVLVVPEFMSQNTAESAVARAEGESPARAPAGPTAALELPDPASTRANARVDVPASMGNNVVLEPTETSGTILGRVVDAENRPAVDLVVIASSIQRQGKFSRFSARAKTERDGRFRLRVAVGSEGVTNYDLSLEGRLEIESPAAADLVRVATDATVDVGILKLAPRVVDQEGSFELDVKLVDARGTPVTNVTAVLFRAVRSPDGWSNRTWEAGGRVDGSGELRLAGQHVGPKILVVDAREQGFKRVRRELELGPGAQALTIQLEPGLEINGRLVDVHGVPITRPAGESHFGNALQLYAIDTDESREWIFATIEEDGRFKFVGLDARVHRLEISNGPWSSICMDGVRAGDSNVVITLKLNDDPIDHGDHCAEIHARLVDEATRSPVPVDIERVHVVELDSDVRAPNFDVDIAPHHLFEVPVQREGSGFDATPSDRVRVGGLEGGTYAFIVRAPGFAPEFLAPITLQPHEMRSDLVLALARPTHVVGRVLDGAGQPCPNAFVLVNGTGPRSGDRLERIDRDVVDSNGNPRAATWELARTDGEGKFKIDGLSPRYDYVISALHPRFQPVSSARVKGSEPGALELRFSAPR